MNIQEIGNDILGEADDHGNDDDQIMVMQMFEWTEVMRKCCKIDDELMPAMIMIMMMIR